MNGKILADNHIIAFQYILLSLEDMGHERTDALIEAAQKMATTVGIEAAKADLNLRLELGKSLREKLEKRNHVED